MARVLLQKRKIVILDEASSRYAFQRYATVGLHLMDNNLSSMDVETDEKIQDIVSEHLKDCTIFSVAHRICEHNNYSIARFAR